MISLSCPTCHNQIDGSDSACNPPKCLYSRWSGHGLQPFTWPSWDLGMGLVPKLWNYGLHSSKNVTVLNGHDHLNSLLFCSAWHWKITNAGLRPVPASHVSFPDGIFQRWSKTTTWWSRCLTGGRSNNKCDYHPKDVHHQQHSSQKMVCNFVIRCASTVIARNVPLFWTTFTVMACYGHLSVISYKWL